MKCWVLMASHSDWPTLVIFSFPTILSVFGVFVLSLHGPYSISHIYCEDDLWRIWHGKSGYSWLMPLLPYKMQILASYIYTIWCRILILYRFYTLQDLILIFKHLLWPDYIGRICFFIAAHIHFPHIKHLNFKYRKQFKQRHTRGRGIKKRINIKTSLSHSLGSFHSILTVGIGCW